MNAPELVSCLRAAGSVERCHALPHHGSYSVAAHSWGVMTLLLALHPTPSPDLLLAAALHDVPERWTGDVPCTVKWASPEVSAALGLMEANVFARLGLEMPKLEDEDAQWLHAVDKLELWLWCKDQEAVGNTLVAGVLLNLNKWFARQTNVPAQVFQVKESYNSRSPDGILG